MQRPIFACNHKIVVNAIIAVIGTAIGSGLGMANPSRGVAGYWNDSHSSARTAGTLAQRNCFDWLGQAGASAWLLDG
jgi:hypothetical protein